MNCCPVQQLLHIVTVSTSCTEHHTHGILRSAVDSYWFHFRLALSAARVDHSREVTKATAALQTNRTVD